MYHGCNMNWEGALGLHYAITYRKVKQSGAQVECTTAKHLSSIFARSAGFSLSGSHIIVKVNLQSLIPA